MPRSLVKASLLPVGLSGGEGTRVAMRLTESKPSQNLNDHLLNAKENLSLGVCLGFERAWLFRIENVIKLDDYGDYS